MKIRIIIMMTEKRISPLLPPPPIPLPPPPPPTRPP